MFIDISSSYVSDFYRVWLKVCVAIDVKSENVTMKQSKSQRRTHVLLRIEMQVLLSILVCYICSETKNYKNDTNSKIFIKT